MSHVIVFNGGNSLEFQELRLNVVRIPDVLARVRMAQRIWNRLEYPVFDLLNFIISSDSQFSKNILYKKFATAIVQVGLYDRLIRTGTEPKFVVGYKGPENAIEACLDKQSFYNLVTESPLVRWLQTGSNVYSMSSMQDQDLKFSVYSKKDNQNWSALDLESQELKEIVRELVDKQGSKKFVIIGPAPISQKLKYEFEMENLEFMDSVDMDPMLNWFWRELNSIDQVAHQA